MMKPKNELVTFTSQSEQTVRVLMKYMKGSSQLVERFNADLDALIESVQRLNADLDALAESIVREISACVEGEHELSIE